MARLLELTRDRSAGSPQIFVEIKEYPSEVGGIDPASPLEGVIDHARQTFDKVMDNIKETTEAVATKLSQLDVKPNEFEVEFGVALKSESGIIITSGAVEANFKITLKWK